MSETSKQQHIRPRRIFLDPYESALTVEYEVETWNDERRRGKMKYDIKQTKVWLSDNDDDEEYDDENMNRRMRRKIAKKIVKKCHYIPEEWTSDVERILMELRSRRRGGDGGYDVGYDGAGQNTNNYDDDDDDDYDVAPKGAAVNRRERKTNKNNNATIENVDSYLDLLYTDDDEHNVTGHGGIDNKTRGISSILSLCRNVQNLENLIQHHRLMSALSRTLGENESRRSLELRFHLCRIFLAFSNFEELHGILGNYRVGSLILGVLDWEVRRRHAAVSTAAAAAAASVAHEKDGRMRSAKTKDLLLLSQRQDNLIFVCLSLLMNLSQDISIERKMVKKKLIFILCHCLHLCRSKRCVMVILTFLKKLTIYDTNVTDVFLSSSSSSSSYDEYFKSTAITKKDEDMKNKNKNISDKGGDSVKRIVALLHSSSSDIISLSLKILFNLSFDRRCRNFLIRSDDNLLSQLAYLSLRKSPSVRAMALRLMYNLSVTHDGRSRLLLVCRRGKTRMTDVTRAIVRLIVNFPPKRLAKELAALAINISAHPVGAEQLLLKDAIRHFLSRVKNYNDVFLAKVLHNLSRWTYTQQMPSSSSPRTPRDNDEISSNDDKENNDDDGDNSEAIVKATTQTPTTMKRNWDPHHIRTIIELCLASYDNHLLLYELLGILGNLTHDNGVHLPSVSLGQITAALPSFLGKLFLPGMTTIDVLSQAVNVAGRWCVFDEESAGLFVGAQGGDGGGRRLLRALDDFFRGGFVFDDDGDEEDEKNDDGRCRRRRHSGDSCHRDDVFMYRCLLLYRNMIYFKETREVLLYHTGAMEHIMSCVDDNHRGIKKVAEECMDLILENDRSSENGSLGRFGHQVCEIRFLLHNKRWLDECVDDGDQQRLERQRFQQQQEQQHDQERFIEDHWDHDHDGDDDDNDDDGDNSSVESNIDT